MIQCGRCAPVPVSQSHAIGTSPSSSTMHPSLLPMSRPPNICPDLSCFPSPSPLVFELQCVQLLVQIFQVFPCEQVLVHGHLLFLVALFLIVAFSQPIGLCSSTRAVQVGLCRQGGTPMRTFSQPFQTAQFNQTYPYNSWDPTKPPQPLYVFLCIFHCE